MSRDKSSEISIIEGLLICAFLFLPGILTGQNPTLGPGKQFLKANRILIIAPHPDDEILGFAGIIYDAIRQKKEVLVVIVTNGDGYGSACYFWKNGCPKEDSLCKGFACSPAELENYGKVRLSESKRALKILGLDSTNVIALGYPDGWIGEMLRHPDNLYIGNTSRHQSFTGKPFTGKNLKEDLKKVIISQSDEEIYTVHIKDSHDDHASLAEFIQEVRSGLVKENILFPVYWSIIHEPAGDNNLWPNPECNWEYQKGEMMIQREGRYTPWDVLRSPYEMKDQATYYFLMEPLWADGEGHPSVMRLAMDQYQTGIGLMRSDGSHVMKGYQGWMDRNGYLLSFIKRNHLFWEAPFPCIIKHQKGPCREIMTIYPLDSIVKGVYVDMTEGSCSCQSELSGGEGIRIGSGLEEGRAWFDFGPVFKDSVMVNIGWTDNSWRSDEKRLEIFNWNTHRWETVIALSGNDEKKYENLTGITLRQGYTGPLHQLRIAVSASKNARIHLEYISVK